MSGNPKTGLDAGALVTGPSLLKERPSSSLQTIKKGPERDMIYKCRRKLTIQQFNKSNADAADRKRGVCEP